MNGPEHYAEAERLLGVAGNIPSIADTLVAKAQVHATLAQTAATMDLVGATVNGQVSPGWSDALGVERQRHVDLGPS